MIEISRRELMKTALIAAIAPVIPATASAVKVPLPVFTEFVGEYWRTAYRFDLPFAQGGFLFATDSRVLIRVPTSRRDDLPPADVGQRQREFPPVAKVWNDYASTEGEWRPWPEQQWLIDPAETCGTLEGEECVNCEGAGCTACVGTGYESPAKTCRVCRGTGFWMAQRVAGRTVAAKFDWKLRQCLPSPLEFLDDGLGDGKNPVRFRFNGGEGLLMPLEDDSKFRRMTGIEKARLVV